MTLGLSACGPLLLIVATGPSPGPGVLNVGTRVRASAPAISAAPLVGTVTKLSSDAIELAVAGRDAPILLPRTSLSRLEVRTGHSRGKGAKRGLMIGALAGAVVGGVGCRDSGDWDSWMCAAILGGMGGALGAGVGGVVGAGDHWTPVLIDRVELGIGPTPGVGLGLTMRLGF